MTADKDGEVPLPTEGHAPKHSPWASIPCIILIFIGIYFAAPLGIAMLLVLALAVLMVLRIVEALQRILKRHSSPR